MAWPTRAKFGVVSRTMLFLPLMARPMAVHRPATPPPTMTTDIRESVLLLFCCFCFNFYVPRVGGETEGFLKKIKNFGSACELNRHRVGRPRNFLFFLKI